MNKSERDKYWTELIQTCRVSGLSDYEWCRMRMDKTPESKSYIWLYTSGAFEKHRIVIYEYQPTRGGYHAAKFLADYHGYVHTARFILGMGRKAESTWRIKVF